MTKTKTIIRFEDNGDGSMATEVRGEFGDLLNLLLTGIEKTFDDEIERAMFKYGVKQVFKNWKASEGEEENE